MLSDLRRGADRRKCWWTRSTTTSGITNPSPHDLPVRENEHVDDDFHENLDPFWKMFATRPFIYRLLQRHRRYRPQTILVCVRDMRAKGFRWATAQGALMSEFKIAMGDGTPELNLKKLFFPGEINGVDDYLKKKNGVDDECGKQTETATPSTRAVAEVPGRTKETRSGAL
nr:hypothetical protein Itr_chr11CG14850 [Ipomoea trifida]